MKSGVYRLIARDGTVGVMQVADGDKIVEVGTVGKRAAPSRPSRRRVASSFTDLHDQAAAARARARLEMDRQIVEALTFRALR